MPMFDTTETRATELSKCRGVEKEQTGDSDPTVAGTSSQGLKWILLVIL
jgi:hypothetical protein